MPAVDCHAHVFSRDAPAVARARYRPTYAAMLEEWQSGWVSAGISHGVLVQPSFFGTDNREMLDAIALDAQRLRGVAVVDPSFDAAALRKLDAQGVRALRLNLQGEGERIAEHFEGPWRELLQRCAGIGWHLEIFADAGIAPRVVRALEPVAIDVVFDHFAAPDPARPLETYEALATLARARGVWCKLSPPYSQGTAAPPASATAANAACARAAIEAVGRTHVVWGSDWPFTRHEERQTYGRLRGELESWCGALAGDVLWDNAARLYRFA